MSFTIDNPTTIGSFSLVFTFSGRKLNPGKGKVHGMAYGSKRITPGNLNQALLQMQAESAGNMGSLIGKRQHKPLTITKEVDVSSPQLFKAHWSQEVIASLNLSFVRPSSGAGEQPYFTISLTNGAIVNYKTYHGLQAPPVNHPRPGSMSVHTNELEEFDLTFQKITYTNVLKSKSTTDDWLVG
jgi:type VI secretion system Hcp family effector